jgi:hypothetical protein
MLQSRAATVRPTTQELRMDLSKFRESLAGSAPPPESGPLLQALWHDANGEWDRAHKLAQSQKGKTGARVHAYLHRKEGDLDNAAYWYGRAGETMPQTSLEQEWEALVTMLMAENQKKR